MRLTRAQLLKGGVALVVLGKLPALPEAAPATVADGLVWPVAEPPVQLWTPRLGWRMIQRNDADYEMWQLTWQDRNGMIKRDWFAQTQTLQHAKTYGNFSPAQEAKYRLERQVYEQGGRMNGTAVGEAKDWWPLPLPPWEPEA
jgi:hypothetical protein